MGVRNHIHVSLQSSRHKLAVLMTTIVTGIGFRLVLGNLSSDVLERLCV